MGVVAPVESPVKIRRRLLPAGSVWARPLAIVGIVIAGIWIVIAIAAPLLAPAGPLAQDVPGANKGPSWHHLFGTDELGRDVLSRVMYGSRHSLPVAILLVALAVLIGGTLGALAGYFGGFLDGLIMRATDLVFAFPAIILAMVVTAALGPSLTNAVLALVIVSWPSYARVVRGLVRSLKEADYVSATRLFGSSARSALLRDIMPNVLGPVAVLATLDLGNAILLLSGLSFLGLGSQPPTPEWGAGVAEGINYFQYWWIGAFPGFAIFTAVLAFNLLGDSLRDALDPTSSLRKADATI
jgi:peptide/nickel transport system permease protein